MTADKSAPFARGSDTSQAAAETIERDLGRLQALVLKTIIKLRGATCDELEAELGLPHQTVSARVWELHKRGVIEDSGIRRTTRSGRNAAVYMLSDEAKRARLERQAKEREEREHQTDLFAALFGGAT